MANPERTEQSKSKFWQLYKDADKTNGGFVHDTKEINEELDPAIYDPASNCALVRDESALASVITQLQFRNAQKDPNSALTIAYSEKFDGMSGVLVLLVANDIAHLQISSDVSNCVQLEVLREMYPDASYFDASKPHYANPNLISILQHDPFAAIVQVEDDKFCKMFLLRPGTNAKEATNACFMHMTPNFIFHVLSKLHTIVQTTTNEVNCIALRIELISECTLRPTWSTNAGSTHKEKDAEEASTETPKKSNRGAKQKKDKMLYYTAVILFDMIPSDIATQDKIRSNIRRWCNIPHNITIHFPRIQNIHRDHTLEINQQLKQTNLNVFQTQHNVPPLFVSTNNRQKHTFSNLAIAIFEVEDIANTVKATDVAKKIYNCCYKYTLEGLMFAYVFFGLNNKWENSLLKLKPTSASKAIPSFMYETNFKKNFKHIVDEKKDIMYFIDVLNGFCVYDTVAKTDNAKITSVFDCVVLNKILLWVDLKKTLENANNGIYLNFAYDRVLDISEIIGKIFEADEQNNVVQYASETDKTRQIIHQCLHNLTTCLNALNALRQNSDGTFDEYISYEKFTKHCEDKKIHKNFLPSKGVDNVERDMHFSYWKYDTDMKNKTTQVRKETRQTQGKVEVHGTKDDPFQPVILTANYCMRGNNIALQPASFNNDAEKCRMVAKPKFTHSSDTAACEIIRYNDWNISRVNESNVNGTDGSFDPQDLDLNKCIQQHYLQALTAIYVIFRFAHTWNASNDTTESMHAAHKLLASYGGLLFDIFKRECIRHYEIEHNVHRASHICHSIIKYYENFTPRKKYEILTQNNNTAQTTPHATQNNATNKGKGAEEDAGQNSLTSTINSTNAEGPQLRETPIEEIHHHSAVLVSGFRSLLAQTQQKKTFHPQTTSVAISTKEVERDTSLWSMAYTAFRTVFKPLTIKEKIYNTLQKNNIVELQEIFFETNIATLLEQKKTLTETLLSEIDRNAELQKQLSNIDAHGWKAKATECINEYVETAFSRVLQQEVEQDTERWIKTWLMRQKLLPVDIDYGNSDNNDSDWIFKFEDGTTKTIVFDKRRETMQSYLEKATEEQTKMQSEYSEYMTTQNNLTVHMNETTKIKLKDVCTSLITPLFFSRRTKPRYATKFGHKNNQHLHFQKQRRNMQRIQYQA